VAGAAIAPESIRPGTEEGADVPFVKCSVDGCNARLRPVAKPIPGDKSTWEYPECDVCFRPACDDHAVEVGGRLVCDRCRRESEGRRIPVGVINVGPGDMGG
jgi:hypothetical protein